VRGGERFQVGADFFGVRNIVDVRMGRTFERRIGDARQNTLEIGGLLSLSQRPPHGGVDRSYKHENSDDGAHRD